AALSTPTSRDFVHWRFADAGCRRMGQGRRGRRPQTFTIPVLSICSKLWAEGYLLDHLVGASENYFGNYDPEGFCGLQVHDQLELRGALDGEVSRFGAA